MFTDFVASKSHALISVLLDDRLAESRLSASIERQGLGHVHDVFGELVEENLHLAEVNALGPATAPCEHSVSAELLSNFLISADAHLLLDKVLREVEVLSLVLEEGRHVALLVAQDNEPPIGVCGLNSVHHCSKGNMLETILCHRDIC